MPTYHERIGGEFIWRTSSHTKLAFELKAGENVLATLTWNAKGRALGQWGQERYWFTREGWFRQHTIVRTAAGDVWNGDEEPFATFAHRGSGGALACADGQAFRWKKPKVWTNERVWMSANNALVHFWMAHWRTPTTVTIEPTAAMLPEIPLLVLLGEYLHVLASEDAEAASVAASIVVISS